MKISDLNIPLGEVHIGLLTDQIRISATDAFDLSQGIHDLLPAVNIGVQKTQDELEVRLLAGHERCKNTGQSQHILAEKGDINGNSVSPPRGG